MGATCFCRACRPQVDRLKTSRSTRASGCRDSHRAIQIATPNTPCVSSFETNTDHLNWITRYLVPTPHRPSTRSSFDPIHKDAWVYNTNDNRQGQFIRDEWARQTQLAMGQPAAHGTWVHLYINGLYWGLYNPTERPDATFNASYVGASKDDFDVIKNHEEVIDGEIDAYRELLTAIQNDPRNFSRGYRDLSGDAAYQRLQGNNPDGTRNPDFPVLIDVSSLIDFTIVGAYAAAIDWPGNYYMARDRSESSSGFKFFMWDNEHGMKHQRADQPHRASQPRP